MGDWRRENTCFSKRRGIDLAGESERKNRRGERAIPPTLADGVSSPNQDEIRIDPIGRERFGVFGGDGERRKKKQVGSSKGTHRQGTGFRHPEKYKEGLSIEKAVKELEMSVGKFMGPITELGIRSPVSYEGYKEGIEALKGALKQKD